MAEVKIKLDNVCKTFGKKIVLRGVNLDIHKGESFVVIGGSGTGKSVLIKCIQGLLTPEEGSILVDGKEVVGINETEKESCHIADRRRVRFVPLFGVEYRRIPRLHEKFQSKTECTCLRSKREVSRRFRK